MDRPDMLAEFKARTLLVSKYMSLRFSILGRVYGVKGQTFIVLTLCSQDFELSMLLWYNYGCGRTKNNKVR